MPLARQLVVDECHSSDVADRKGTLCAISIVVDPLEHFDVLVAVHQLVPVRYLLVLEAVAHERVRQHHLSHTDRAAPARVRSLADFKIAADVPWLCLEPLGELLLLANQKWHEVAAVAEPDQKVEVDLELV